MTLTFTISGTLSSTDGFSGIVFCISGGTTAAFDLEAHANGTAAFSSGTVSNAPSITPTTSNGLIVAMINEIGETVTAVSVGNFHAVDIGTYESFTGDQDGGHMHYYNPNTSTVNINWTYSAYEVTTPNIGGWAAQALAFKAPVASTKIRHKSVQSD
jgi:hypothetical protein